MKIFYCYNKSLYKFLKEEGFRYIFSGYTNKQVKVVLYEKTPELEKAIQDYMNLQDDWE